MKTPITYYGGKQTLLKYILPLIPPHKLYTEAFCGGCAVLFAKEPVECEVINDVNKKLINFYIISKKHYNLLKREIDSTLHCRDQHTHAAYINANPEWFSPIQAAWAVWTLSRLSYASKQNGTFGYDKNGTTAKKIDNAKINYTEILCNRLSRVTIENRDGLKVIETYDTEDAFHFVDPPYINSNCGHYTGSFLESDFINLLDLLSKIKGKFMLTMFPHTLIVNYAEKYGWTIHKVERTITASKTYRRKQEEWIIVNYIN
ncbi:MAG: DNA adenine methylase [Bacteroidales bacterium]